MLAELTALILPDWLRDANPSEDELPMGALQRDSVFSPASHVDGSPMKFRAGYRHSFVNADFGHSGRPVSIRWTH